MAKLCRDAKGRFISPHKAKAKTTEEVTGYKGFRADLCCTPGPATCFQYELNKTYKHRGAIEICESGFHFCTYPLDVLVFYAPGGGCRYAMVTALGKTVGTDSILALDSKAVTDKLRVNDEISTGYLGDCAMQYLISKSKRIDAPGDPGVAVRDQRGVLVGGSNTRVTAGLKKCTGVEQVAAAGVAFSDVDKSFACAWDEHSVAACTGERSVAKALQCNSVAAVNGMSSIASTKGLYSVAASFNRNSVAVARAGCSVAYAAGVLGRAEVETAYSVAVATYMCSSAVCDGHGSVAVGTGRADNVTVVALHPASVAVLMARNGRAKGVRGSLLVFAKWDASKTSIVGFITKVVDGVDIKANVWYAVNGDDVYECYQY